MINFYKIMWIDQLANKLDGDVYYAIKDALIHFDVETVEGFLVSRLADYGTRRVSLAKLEEFTEENKYKLNELIREYKEHDRLEQNCEK